jgi:hypothetical protein
LSALTFEAEPVGALLPDDAVVAGLTVVEAAEAVGPLAAAAGELEPTLPEDVADRSLPAAGAAEVAPTPEEEFLSTPLEGVLVREGTLPEGPDVAAFVTVVDLPRKEDEPAVDESDCDDADVDADVEDCNADPAAALPVLSTPEEGVLLRGAVLPKDPDGVAFAVEDVAPPVDFPSEDVVDESDGDDVDVDDDAEDCDADPSAALPDFFPSELDRLLLLLLLDVLAFWPAEVEEAVEDGGGETDVATPKAAGLDASDEAELVEAEVVANFEVWDKTPLCRWSLAEGRLDEALDAVVWRRELCGDPGEEDAADAAPDLIPAGAVAFKLDEPTDDTDAIEECLLEAPVADAAFPLEDVAESDPDDAGCLDCVELDADGVPVAPLDVALLLALELDEAPNVLLADGAVEDVDGR